MNRMLVAFVPHGGGPWPFVDFGLPEAELETMKAYLRGLRALPAVPPRALLVVSAHWEEEVPTVMSSPRPPMLYDYGGFPPEAYRITWPAPGDPALAARVMKLVDGAENLERGFDHGTFVPLKVAFPEAEIPTVQLSLMHSLDPAEHLKLGRALAPLRDEGVFIIGSGNTFHNLRSFFGGGSREPAAAFDTWAQQAIALEPKARDAALIAWRDAPHAKFSHPREEHLIPLHVIAGAAGADRGQVTWTGTFAGLQTSGFHFG